MMSFTGENLLPELRLEIGELLATLLADVLAVLGDYFAGLYIHGSLASGDFNPERSDIDFLVVTNGELPAGMLPVLAAMHARLASSCSEWARILEGSYIPRQALRRYDPQHASHPALRVDGSFDVDYHASDWVIQRHVLREHGVTLAGPPMRDLIDPVSPDELRAASRGILEQWWAPMLADPSRLHSGEYQVYAVLTMCRLGYTLAHGEVVSKPAAAAWARANLDPRWTDLVREAETWGYGRPFEHLDETQELIRLTLSCSLVGGSS